ncbi:MAG: Gfo/Idh/MocA family oxidoreductase [Fuerstiella sp.]|nr:Gfo/Idh/MocA family oxidoreductase [Fuerstiella sp.]
MNTSDISRRAFVGTTAATAAGLHAGISVAQSRFSANDTIRVGMIGPGGRGTQLMLECMDHGSNYGAQVTAVCDIWDQRRDVAQQKVKEVSGSDPRVCKNIATILDDPNIDAVIIGTADHQHAKMLRMAVEAGKDVYCEKPMGNVLEETNAALDAVNKSGRVVQIGTQRRSYPKYRQAQKLMQSGVLGDIVKVDIIANAYSPYRWAKSKQDLASLKKHNVDWSAFLMGKSDRPFDPRIYRSFRLFRDFSSGIIDQWMTHSIDAVHMLTGESYPESAVAHGGIYQFHDYRENPDTIQVALSYGQDDRKFLAQYSVSLSNGAGSAWRVMGTRGTMQVEHDFRITGDGVKSKNRITEVTEISDAPGTLHHMANWLDCVRRQDIKGTYCPVEAGYGHSVACILSAQSYWTGRKMTFDPQSRTMRSA